jgi:hypothetical protein|tara:strand:- start:498 stop:1256 length:759 start_codon:yes stop_codon:yes gene_type:complete
MLKLTALCSIHVIGDWGRRGQFSQIPVADKLRNIDHDAVISTGDNFYPEGITDPKDPQIYESWYDIYKPEKPWYVALGNHDHRGNATVQTLIDLPHWNLPWPVYAKNICNHTFVFMDTTYVSGDQWKHVEHLLTEGTSNKWIVAHHPIYSGGWHYLVNDDYRDKMTEIYKKYNVRAILSGHDHNLQYVEWGDVRQIVSGAGSSTYGAKSPQEGVKFFSEDVGFVQLELYEDITNIKYIGLDQTLFETEIKTI